MDHSNPAQRHITLVSVLVLFFTLSAAAQTTTAAQPPRREQFAHADVLYDWVSNRRGCVAVSGFAATQRFVSRLPIPSVVSKLKCPLFVASEMSG